MTAEAYRISRHRVAPTPGGPLDTPLERALVVIEGLKRRVEILEQRVDSWRFCDRVRALPRLSAREIVLLWLEYHETVSVRSVSVELYGVGVQSHALAVAAYRLWQAGVLVKLGPALYRKAWSAQEEP